MFVTHPGHRTKTTFACLFNQIMEHLKSSGATSLVSNVFKVNKLSVAFHKKLGFKVTREAALGYEFTLDLKRPEANIIVKLIEKLSNKPK